MDSHSRNVVAMPLIRPTATNNQCQTSFRNPAHCGFIAHAFRGLGNSTIPQESWGIAPSLRARIHENRRLVFASHWSSHVIAIELRRPERGPRAFTRGDLTDNLVVV